MKVEALRAMIGTDHWAQMAAALAVGVGTTAIVHGRWDGSAVANDIPASPVRVLGVTGCRVPCAVPALSHWPGAPPNAAAVLDVYALQLYAM